MFADTIVLRSSFGLRRIEMPRFAKCLAVVLLGVLCGCEIIGPESGGPSRVMPPPGFGPVPSPAFNPTTEAKVYLGRKLFFDPSLSRDGTIACATCHDPRKAFADTRPLSTGVSGRVGTRNAPSLVNVAYRPLLFWDGRSSSLEDQVVAPLESDHEMDEVLSAVLDRLNADSSYSVLFADVFGEPATATTFTRAIAAYERTIVGSGAPYDRYIDGRPDALDDAQVRGAALFFGDAGCVGCHGGIRFTDDSFRNNGLVIAHQDSGRAHVTHDPQDVGRFRVPTLRNVELTAPYMHDGRLSSLEEVVNHYNRGGAGTAGQDASVRPLNLTSGQRDDFIAFLRSLTDDSIRSGLGDKAR